MITTNYKSLDRPFDFFGLKGKWVVVFLIGTGICVLLGVIIGCTVASSYGIATAIFGAVASFGFCLMKQDSVTERKIGKSMISSKCRQNVVRHEQLSRILLPDANFENSRSKK